VTGRTDIEIEISNQCARLIANAIIYYNSAILSHLLTKCEASGNAKAVALITKISPAAWRHILLNGHYNFQSDGKTIDLDALVAGLELGRRKFLGFRLTTPIWSQLIKVKQEIHMWPRLAGK
jgi:hypothetical protein